LKIKKVIRNKDIFNLLNKQNLKFQVESFAEWRNYYICIETKKYRAENNVPSLLIKLDVPNNKPYDIFNYFDISFSLYLPSKANTLKEEKAIYLLEKLKKLYEFEILDKQVKLSPIRKGQYWLYEIMCSEEKSFHVLWGDPNDKNSVLKIRLQPQLTREFLKAEEAECYAYIMKFLKVAMIFVEQCAEASYED